MLKTKRQFWPKNPGWLATNHLPNESKQPSKKPLKTISVPQEPPSRQTREVCTLTWTMSDIHM